MSKLQYDGIRLEITEAEAINTIHRVMKKCGCPEATALAVANHLADSSLCGVESHGLMRVLQYAGQFSSGYMLPAGRPKISKLDAGGTEVDGQGGIGIPAMQLAMEHSCELASAHGIAAIAVRNSGHTGRLGAFAEEAAKSGFLTITLGGGNRHTWRQVAPYGGRQAKLPTNPYCIGLPGGDLGPVVLDFATSKIAGGWIYAAKSAGARLPDGVMIDAAGNPSTDPQDYFDGGAILPAGGAKGYALALMAELIGEALLGKPAIECNWLMITINTTNYQDRASLHSAAEEILADIRSCPPSPGFDRVEIPGERERETRRRNNGMIAIPEPTWQQILELAEN